MDSITEKAIQNVKEENERLHSENWKLQIENAKSYDRIRQLERIIREK